jgi:hypothetical protein
MPTRNNRTITLRLLAFAGVALFLGLVYTNHLLRRRLDETRHALRRAQQQLSSHVVSAGERFESLRVLDASDRPRILEANGRGPVLVAVVNPTCDSCVEVADAVKEVLRTHAGGTVWLLSQGDAAGTRDFARRHGVEAVTYRLPDDLNPFVRQRLARAPQVFVVDGHENVVRTCETVASCAAEARGAAVASNDGGR